MDDTALPEKRRFLTFRKLLVLLLLLVAAFAGYTRFSASQHTNSQQVSDEVFEVRLHNVENSIPPYEKRLEDLEQKVAKLAAAPAAIPSASATTAPGEEGRIAALEKEIAAFKSVPQVQQAQGNEQLYQAIRLLSAFHRFSDKVMAGRPFASELAAFEDLDPDEAKAEPITTLAPYADNGIPTFAILLASFDQALDQLNAAQAIPPADASLWERFVYNLEHLVSIRKIDAGGTDKSIDAIVARAQAHLEREEIEAAEAEIKSLPEDARSNFTVWLDDAQMATEVPSLVDQIEEQVMQTAFHTEAAPQAIKGQK